jgi:hypothetical protein
MRVVSTIFSGKKSQRNDGIQVRGQRLAKFPIAMLECVLSEEIHFKVNERTLPTTAFLHI